MKLFLSGLANSSRRCVRLGLFGCLLLLSLGPIIQAVPRGKDSEPSALALEKAFIKARSTGKYKMLLTQIKVPKDFDKFKNFTDLGRRTVSEYQGHKNLPAGYWVYVYPYWYIWRDATNVYAAKRNWGPEQATGAPDTWPRQGDIVTAWASKTADGQKEWLTLEYDHPVVPKEVQVYETFNPGAVYRITAFNLKCEEVEVWKGKDPSAQGSGKGISKIPCKANFKSNRIKIYIDSPSVLGWNEIDAVALVGTNGKSQWARSADASSTYAQ